MNIFHLIIKKYLKKLRILLSQSNPRKDGYETAKRMQKCWLSFHKCGCNSGNIRNFLILKIYLSSLEYSTFYSINFRFLPPETRIRKWRKSSSKVSQHRNVNNGSVKCRFYDNCEEFMPSTVLNISSSSRGNYT